MNIKGLVVAAAMMGSAAVALGCNNLPTLDTSAEASDLATQVAEGAVPETSNWFSWRVWFGAPKVEVARPVARTYYKTTYVKYAPPAARYERVGVAPSHRHFWVPGHYTWSGSRFVWNGGRWESKRSGYEYVPAHWSKLGGHWYYQPASWKRA